VVVIMIKRSHWQVQEAKMRFSELLRAVATDGPQTITRHGEDVAVIFSIQEYRELVGPAPDFKALLMSFPKMDVDGPDVFDEIEEERKTDFMRPFDVDDLDIDEESRPR
jgi:prevent-host-death family protein